MSSSETTSVSQNNHSLNERKEDNYRRDSFEDRFCDDLCEDILQYLSLEDKLRLQSVSKQFQRTVFQRQYELFVNVRRLDSHEFYLGNKDFSNRNDFNYYYIENRSLDSFKALLKKCPNITSIQLDGHDRFDPNYDQDINNRITRVIIENCNNLSAINEYGIFNESNFEEFKLKFGPKMKYLPFDRDFTQFPNIEKLLIMYRNDETIVPQLNLAKLKELDIILGPSQEHMFEKFIEKFPALKYVKLFINSSDENAIFMPLKNISNLKHLIRFTFHDSYPSNNDIFFGLLKQLANYCRKIKCIQTFFVIDPNSSDLKQSLSQLKALPALKRLYLTFYFVRNEENNVNQLFSFELFKGFANITHLGLDFD